MIDYLDIPLQGNSPDRAGEFDPDGNLGSANFDDVARKILVSTLKNARLLGSEPLAHSKLAEVIGLLRVHNFERIRVQTGGWPLLNQEMSDRFFKMGIRLFEVRFLSSRRKEHDRLAGKHGSFEAAWTAINRVRKAGPELRGGGPTFIEARLVVTPQNLVTLERTICEASRWPVNQLAVVPGRLRFSLFKASSAIQKGIERAIQKNCWVYLEKWPACLFPKLELHLRELTRKLEGNRFFSQQCEGCVYSIFCAGIPEWAMLGQEPFIPTPPPMSRHNWGRFHARVILQKD